MYDVVDLFFINDTMDSYNKLDEVLGERKPPWLRQIITPILHNMETCINECTAVVKGYPEGSGSLPAPRSGHAASVMSVLLIYLFIYVDPDCHQRLINSSLYYPGCLDKLSLQSIPNILSNVACK